MYAEPSTSSACLYLIALLQSPRGFTSKDEFEVRWTQDGNTGRTQGD